MLPKAIVESGLAQLEAEGQVLRGRFSQGLAADRVEWCNRRLLARIHRLTLRRLRREIEPVTTADFIRFLCRWQHLAPGGCLHGVDGTLQIIKQLQGYETSAAAWESQILPQRIVDYKAELLDRTCLSGEVMWGRLSPHPAFEAEQTVGQDGNGTLIRRVRPTRVAPITLWLREDAGWLLGEHLGPAAKSAEPPLSHAAREALQVHGELDSAACIDPSAGS